MMVEDLMDWLFVMVFMYEGGLGFNYKWNMGWMNDVLIYMEVGVERCFYFYDKMIFLLMYVFNENFILLFFYDEVVYGKKLLFNKMLGDYWCKFVQF